MHDLDHLIQIITRENCLPFKYFTFLLNDVENDYHLRQEHHKFFCFSISQYQPP